MKENQLSHRFRYFQRHNPNLGDLIVLSKSVRGMKYNKSKINQAFNKYISKDDYDHNDRDILLENLYKVTLDSEKYGLIEPTQKS